VAGRWGHRSAGAGMFREDMSTYGSKLIERRGVYCDAARDGALASVLEHARRGFRFYAKRLDEAQRETDGDPRSVLAQLAPITGEQFVELQAEVLERLSDRHFVGDVSSGTGGQSKLRFTSPEDEAAEASVCERFLRQLGMPHGEQVAAIDVGASEIYAFLGQVLNQMLGARFTFVTLPGRAADVAHLIRRLADLRITTLVTVPSALARIVCHLDRGPSSSLWPGLLRVVTVGEPTSDAMRANLQCRGIEVYSLFGTTETGWIGGECRYHRGVHLYDDVVIPTLINPVRMGPTIRGEALWTTLHLLDQPLLQFASHDLVSLDMTPCPCGVSGPRLVEIQRTTDQIVLYGHKVQYIALRDSIERALGAMEFMQLYVCRDGGTYELHVLIPRRLQRKSTKCYEAVRSTGGLGEFAARGLLRIRINCVDRPVSGGRKVPGVIGGARGRQLVIGIHEEVKALADITSFS
jgi:phenylacetate-coenzyme A ligase PaaK-like adenylate-forming protein